MALSTLSAPADFFKQLSNDYEQLQFILRVQEHFVLSVVMYDYKWEDYHLLYLIEQLEVLILKTHQLKEKVEKQLHADTPKA